MSPLRGTNQGVAQVDFKPKELEVHLANISINLMKLKIRASNTFDTVQFSLKPLRGVPISIRAREDWKRI